jgi:hypothetical protein
MSIDAFVAAVFAPAPGAARAPARPLPRFAFWESNLPAALLTLQPLGSPSRALCGTVCDYSIARRTASVSRVCTSSPMR